MVYYILIRRVGSKKYIGVIPGKKGASKIQLSKRVSKNLKKGYTYRIITQAQLKVFLKKKPMKQYKRKRIVKRRRMKLK